MSLLNRIAAGDQTAVAECLDAYGGLAQRVARRYLDRAPEYVDDAIQEAFLEVWLTASRYNPDRGEESAFIATVIYRKVIDVQRRVGRRYMPEAKDHDGHLPPPTPETPGDPDHVLAQFDRLPPDERDALWLSIHHGLSHSQIGAATKVPIGTVKSRLRRALLRLREALAVPSPAISGVDA